YKLGATADATVISPHTSLVQIWTQVFGTSVDTAITEIKNLYQVYGVTVDPLADYSATDDGASRTAAAIARVLVMVKQDMAQKLGGRLNARDYIDNTLVTLLGQIIQLATDPVITAIPNPDDKLDALRLGVAGIAIDAGLTEENIANAVTIFNSEEPPPPPPAAGAYTRSLRYLEFNSLGDYELAYLAQNQNQSVPDSFNLLRYTENRLRVFTTATGGPANPGSFKTVQRWGNQYKRNRMIWTGESWYYCPENFVNDATVPDAQGSYRNIYCNFYVDQVKPLSTVELGGNTFTMLALTMSLHTGAAQNRSDERPPVPLVWNRTSIRAGALLPKGARLTIEIHEIANPPISYGMEERVRVMMDTFGYRCTPPFAFPANAVAWGQLVKIVGIKCSDGPWAGTWNYAVLPLSPGNDGLIVPGSVVATFIGGVNPVQYRRCVSVYQCDVIGSGSFVIEPLGSQGDQIMRFTNLPAEVSGRVFIKHGEDIFYGEGPGGPSKRTIFNLNTIATDALIKALQIDLDLFPL
ncbi:MAG: hypothetical protein ACRYF5_15250, partial [Janthinobacterium lividum]